MNLLAALIALILIAGFVAAPLAFFTMLFLGNLGLHLSFISVLPGAMAVKIITTNYAQPKETK